MRAIRSQTNNQDTDFCPTILIPVSWNDDFQESWGICWSVEMQQGSWQIQTFVGPEVAIHLRQTLTIPTFPDFHMRDRHEFAWLA